MSDSAAAQLKNDAEQIIEELKANIVPIGKLQIETFGKRAHLIQGSRGVLSFCLRGQSVRYKDIDCELKEWFYPLLLSDDDSLCTGETENGYAIRRLDRECRVIYEYEKEESGAIVGNSFARIDTTSIRIYNKSDELELALHEKDIRQCFAGKHSPWLLLINNTNMMKVLSPDRMTVLESWNVPEGSHVEGIHGDVIQFKTKENEKQYRYLDGSNVPWWQPEWSRCNHTWLSFSDGSTAVCLHFHQGRAHIIFLPPNLSAQEQSYQPEVFYHEGAILKIILFMDNLVVGVTRSTLKFWMRTGTWIVDIPIHDYPESPELLDMGKGTLCITGGWAWDWWYESFSFKKSSVSYTHHVKSLPAPSRHTLNAHHSRLDINCLDIMEELHHADSCGDSGDLP